MLDGRPLLAITEADVVAWATAETCNGAPANNTVRQRLALARTFLAWAARKGIIPEDPADDLQHLNRQYPRTYGRVQSVHKARFLSTAEAARLMDTCDDTPAGIRDAIVLGLGLAGLRNSELRHLTWSNIDGAGRATWIGKANRHRTATLSPTMRDRLATWRSLWRKATGTPPGAHDPVVCDLAERGNFKTRTVVWGKPIGSCDTVGRIVARRAGLAGLGHLTPHDLRRTAASILHHAMSPDGGHRYDLLDIQRVLGHADPATTMRSYLEPLTNAALNDRAASDLDF
jgi:integrase/recombinase XerC